MVSTAEVSDILRGRLMFSVNV